MTLQPGGLQPAKLLSPWDSAGKDTGVGCHALLQGSSRPRNQICVSMVPALQADSLLMSHQGRPLAITVSHENNFITLQIPPVYHLFNLPTLEPLKTIEQYHLCSSVFSRILCK